MSGYPYYGYGVDSTGGTGFLADAWRPNGFIDPGSLAALLDAARHSIYMPAQIYARYDPFVEPYRADESFMPVDFQYIPTESQIGAGIAALNMQAAGIRPGAEKTNDYPGAGQPAMQQLIQSLYSQAADLWQELRAANNTGEW